MAKGTVEYPKGSDLGLLIRLQDEKSRPVVDFNAASAAELAIRSSTDGTDLVSKALGDMTIDAAAGTVSVALDASDTSSLAAGVYLAQLSLTIDSKKYVSSVFYFKLLESFAG